MLYSYLRGQLTFVLIIGVAVGVALFLEGMPFAFALGVAAGISALVPFIGPWIGAIPIELVALSYGPARAIVVGITYLVITNIVLQFLFPRIMGDAVRLPALAVIVAFLAGFNEDAARAIEWTVAHLGKNRLDWLQSLPDCDQIGDEIVLVHGSPRDHIYEYILDGPTADANLNLIDGKICFHGHTHVPGIFRRDDGQLVHEYQLGTFELHGTELVNPGSVGP